MPDIIRDGLQRTLAAMTAIGHAPTMAEWVANYESRMTNDEWRSANDESRMTNGASNGRDIVEQTAKQLIQDGTIRQSFGRIVFRDVDDAIVQRQRADELVIPRKLRVAKRVAKWLMRLGSVRFVALCNTTAFGHGRDESDLDFFVIVRRGTLALTRLAAVMPFKLLGQRPGDRVQRDAVCLSYFISDNALDLSSHMLEREDPYFRYWFLSLLPLADDGIGKELWNANTTITSRYPLAEQWMTSPALFVTTPMLRVPMLRALEPIARKIQSRAFPKAIRELMNRDTRVIVTEDVLKFHVEDRREEYRTRYETICREKGIEI